MASNFEQPSLDWDAKDIYSEYQRFQQHVSFVFKGPLAKSEAKDRAGWIGMWIGKQGREVYKTLTWAEGDEDNPEVILTKLGEYIKPRKNKRVARFKVKQRRQLEGENFDNFVKDLRIILMDCEYTDPDDILIDAIIDGVKQPKVQERLLDQGQNLTLAKAIEIGRQYELSQNQLKMLRGEEVVGLNSVKSFKRDKNPKKFRQKKSKEFHEKKRPQKSGLCNRCGLDISTHKDKCPAIGSNCKYCHKPDHWLAACRKRKRAQVNLLQDESDHEEDELFQIYTTQDVGSNDKDKWTTDVVIQGKPVKFRIDTGARCSIVVKSTYDKLQLNGKVRQSGKVLRTFSNHQIHPLFTVTLPVAHSKPDGIENVDFEIVDIIQENVLSGDTAEKLGLISRVASVEKLQEFPDATKTTGTLPGFYTIKIEPNAQGVVHAPRKQPAALKPKIIEKLKEMEKDNFITKVNQPTEWVNSMVVSMRNGKVRVCLDPKDLNKVIKREHHPMKTVEEVVANIPGATVFSTLDAKSGFLQIKLDEDSSYLTTFNTPIGRYRWLRLPFGIKCAPEIYQRIMDQMLEGIDGSVAIMDDILIAGKNREEHDVILKRVIERATEYNLRLNFDKCQIRQPKVSYVGHIISAEGLSPDPDKIRAIVEMPAPEDKDGVRRFLGLVQYLAKFIPNMSQIDVPIRTLLRDDVEFKWEHEQKSSFDHLKRLCSTPPVLAFYDVNKDVEIQCDASKDGLGAVLIQDGRIIAYSSRSLTSTEKNYAQIEKEMLSIVHGVTKFHCYILGKECTVYNDHKPLEAIHKKPLQSAPMRLQKMLMKLQWYDLKIVYRKGKDMVVADALSRAYLQDSTPETDDFENVYAFDLVSVTRDKYLDIAKRTQSELRTLYEVIMEGWPDNRSDTPLGARPYWDSRAELSVADGIIFKGRRIVIPKSMQQHMLERIHESHLGIAKCKQRAREVMYWPGMNSEIETLVQNCSKCAEFQNRQQSEPLRPTEAPELPYSEVGCDLFDFEGKKHLILVDYYSQYIDVLALHSTTCQSVVTAMKSVFSCHGIPKKLRSDNGPPFQSAEFKSFCDSYGIEHVTSSPYYPISNGEAERAVQTVKKLWRKCEDKSLALLNYRTTPLQGVNLSPSQLLMGRRPRNTLPTSRDLLKPTAYNQQEVKRHFEIKKARQKFYYDSRRGVKVSPSLEPGQHVRLEPTPGSNSETWKPGTVVKHYQHPRSYVVRSGNKLYRRSRKHLRASNAVANAGEHMESDSEESTSPDLKCEDNKGGNSVSLEEPHLAPTSGPPPVVTRSGRRVTPPNKMDL